MMSQVHGLMLMPHETSLFPSEFIKPMFRYRGSDVAWLYQLDVDICPHYRDGCLIYDRRPVICRAFPTEASCSRKLILHESCPEIARLAEKISEKLRDKGMNQLLPVLKAVVLGQKGPLKEGEVEKIRVSVTLTQVYLDAVDRLVDEGIYRGRGEVVMEALRDLFRKQEITPFTGASR